MRTRPTNGARAQCRRRMAEWLHHGGRRARALLPGHPGLVPGRFAAPTPAQVGAWAAIARGATPWSSRRPARARRWRRSCGRSTGWPPSRPRRQAAALPGPLRLAAQGARRRRRAQPALAAGRASATRPPRLGLAGAGRSRVGVRSGDTPADERRRFAREPADILITTPESLFLLLTSPAREALRGRRDGDRRRGARRRRHQARRPPRGLASSGSTRCWTRPAQRIGLSATVRPVEEVARFLAGGRPRQSSSTAQRASSGTSTVVVPVADLADLGQPTGDLSGAAAGDPRAHLDLAARRGAHRRPDRSAPLDARLRQLPPARRAADRPAQRDLGRAAAAAEPPAPSRAPSGAARPGHGPVRRSRAAPPPVLARAHHGSVSKEQRALIEEDLKAGRLPAVVATSQPRARHRHGRGRPRRAGRVAAVRRLRAAAGRPRRPPGRRGLARACSSPSTAATWCRPRSSSSGCGPARSRRCGCPPTRSTCSPSRSSRWCAMDDWTVDDLARAGAPGGAVRRR